MCFANSLAVHGAEADLGWARTLDGDGWTAGDAVAVDGTGDIVVMGSLNGTVDFDPGPGVFNLSSAGENDIFVQKLYANGSFAWARRVGNVGNDEGAGLALGADGEVHVTGSFRDRLDLDPGDGVFELESRGERDAFVLKLDADGGFIWARRMGGTRTDMALAITVDKENCVYSTGLFDGGVDFDPGAGAFNLFSMGDSDIYIQKLDATGNFLWARQVGGSISEEAHGIALDAEGNLLLSGRFVGRIEFESVASALQIDSIGQQDCFILKLDADANLVWARSVGGSGEAIVRNSDLAVDSLGNVYSAGSFTGTVDFDPGADVVNLTSQGFPDIHVLKLDAGGDFGWVRRATGSSTQIVTGIALNKQGDVFTTGYYHGNLHFSGGAILQGVVGVPSGFVQKFDAQGDFVWARSFGGGKCFAQGLAAGGSGEVLASGYFVGTVDFDPGDAALNLTSGEDGAAFVLKLLGPPDTMAPNAASIAPASMGPTNADTVAFSVAFDEDVRNFDDAADLAIEHAGTTHEDVVIDGGPSDYVVMVSGIAGDGSFTLAVNLSSDVRDPAGNAVQTSVTSSAVAIDNTAPLFSGLAAVPVEASAGDVVALSLDASEALAGEPQVTVNGNPAAPSSKEVFAYAYTVADDEALGAALIEIRGEDVAGNTSVSSESGVLEIVQAVVDGESGVEGVFEGEAEGSIEGLVEGQAEGAVEGNIEGDAEGSVEGEGETEGDGEGEGGPATGCNAFGPGGGCNPSAPFSSFKDILGRLFIGTLTVMVLVLMAAGQKRF